MGENPKYYIGVQKNPDGSDDYSRAGILYPKQPSLETPSDVELQTKRAELDTVPASSQEDINKKERKKNLERALELVMTDGGFRVHVSIHRDLSPEGTAGFQDLKTKIKDWRPLYALKSKIKNNFCSKFSLTGSIDFDEELKKRKIEEVLDISYEKTDEYEEVVVPGKAGFLGLGKTEPRTERKMTGRKRFVLHQEYVANGKNEPAIGFTYYVNPEDWRDYSGRRGQMMFVQITMPELSGMQLAEIIKRDPVIIRELIGRLMKDNLLKDPNAWETPQGGGDSLRPPYEKWDKSDVGEHLYIQSEI